MKTGITTPDRFSLHVHRWIVDKPAVTVLLLHGYGEHAGRYAHVASRFNERGLSLTAVDLRGHGRSSGERGGVIRFRDYHRDVDALLEMARGTSPSSPLALLGHSMGGLLACDWMLARRSETTGMVLSSPFLGFGSAVQVTVSEIWLARLASILNPRYSQDSGLRGRDLCGDEELQSLYDEDPLNHHVANARWFTEVLKAMRRVRRRAASLSLPILLLYGSEDKVASPRSIRDFARSLPPGRAESECLEGAQHEILNEPRGRRDEIIDRIADWLLGLVAY